MRALILWAGIVLSCASLSAELTMATVGSITADPQNFDHKAVCVDGEVENLDERVSRKGNAYYTLELVDGSERLRVFAFGRPGAADGALVRACGRFQTEVRVGTHTFHNELSAALVEAPLALFGTIATGQPAKFGGPVVAITDGDTIEVLAEGRGRRIRLEGIDAPEKGQAFGNQAKRCTSQLAFEQEVEVEVTDIDRYGRFVAMVRLPGGKILNDELVRAGCAWWYQRYTPDNNRLQTLEAEAQGARRGLWSDPAPLPPWEFRHPGRNQ